MADLQILSDEELERVDVSDSYLSYINEIRRYPVLSIDEQKQLGILIKENNDEKARTKLINSNLRLVVSIVKKYKDRIKNMDILDIIQEGNLGLMRATKDYDPTQGAFSTYAVTWIDSYIRNSIIKKESIIKIPNHLYYLIIKYDYILKDCKIKNKPCPTDDELCQILNISKSTLKDVKEFKNRSFLSLNYEILNDESVELQEIIPDTRNLYDELLDNMTKREFLLVIKKNLSPLKYYIICRHYLDDNKSYLKKIGEYFQVSRERIRQINNKALKELLYLLKDENLFSKEINRIKDKEGKDYNYLSTEPIEPRNVIRYLYLKDNLTESERKLYLLFLKAKYKYNSDLWARKLGISILELNNIKNSLIAKINSINIEELACFEKEKLLDLGLRLYHIELDKDFVLASDDRLKTIYEYFSDYTKEQIDEMLDRLTEEEREYVRLRFGDNLDEKTISNLEDSQKNYFYNTVVGKMRTILRNKIAPLGPTRKRKFE